MNQGLACVRRRAAVIGVDGKPVGIVDFVVQ